MTENETIVNSSVCSGGEPMLKDKIAIVTGAGRGIGQEIALAMAQAGAKVVLSDISLDFLQETESKIKELGTTECILTQANVTIGDEVTEVVKKALDSLKSITESVTAIGEEERSSPFIPNPATNLPLSVFLKYQSAIKFPPNRSL